MQTGRQCEDAWWAGAVVISGVFRCTIPVPSAIPSLHFGHPLRTKRILLGCPPHLMQKTGVKGTLVSDLFCCLYVCQKSYPAFVLSFLIQNIYKQTKLSVVDTFRRQFMLKAT